MKTLNEIMDQIVGIDFEFYNSNEKDLTLVAAVIDLGLLGLIHFNLFEEKAKENLIFSLLELRDGGNIFVSYATMAEARAFEALGLDPLDFEWIDLYSEFIMLCNSNDKFAYGDYVSSTGQISHSIPPTPYMTDEEKEADTADHTEIPKNLINCAYKMLNLRLDSHQKEEMRALILSQNHNEIVTRMNEILDYCASDTKHLRSIYEALFKALEVEGLSSFIHDQLLRGRYTTAIAKSESLGIPINMNLLNKVIDKTPEILDIHKEDVNGHFPFFIPDIQRPPITRKNGKVFHYKPTPAHKDMAAYQRYVESLQISGFPKTKTGKYKSDKDTLEEWGYWKGLESLWKYNKIESNLKWFNKENKNGFFDRMGNDSRIRPYYGIFGTQTGRNAAKAKTFPLAMSSWLRAIIQAPSESTIIGSDFSQQEVYVAAILSGDTNLLDAYNSGDVYLAFAKQAGLVPEDATKVSHKHERTLCKATVLGLQFGMGHKKLKTKLKLDSGQDVTDERTEQLILAHHTTYKQYWTWVYQLSKRYSSGEPLLTSDGWALFTDNLVMTSVRNFPVQATAASITRLAVIKCWENGLKVMAPLHDAVYILAADDGDIDNTVHWIEQILIECTAKILGQRYEDCTIRIDTKVIRHQDTWIEEKGEKDWNKIKGFLGIQ